MNFVEDREINLPYFLLNILNKMSANVQKRVQFIDNTMHHHGLIKILLEFNRKSVGDSWESFLIKNHFQDAPEQPKGGKNRRSRRRKVDTGSEKSSPQPQQEEEEITIVELMKNKRHNKVKKRGNGEKKSKVSEDLNSTQPRRSSRLRKPLKKTPL